LKIHRPHTKADIAAARDRLKWDEAFVLQVALARRRHADAQLPAVARKPSPDGLLTAFDDRLPFTLTDGQVKVSKEIFDDLATEHPMHRLLQGEVGSGKTMVALRAMLAVVDAGGQAAMLAPTEVLAQQHHRSITVAAETRQSHGRGGCMMPSSCRTSSSVARRSAVPSAGT
ncbi:DEAD/DEAH box helicase, partial [Streptomyces sp. Agncl-13]|uniref:DEAD/DEAH box helicase n=1 Tax=Streptomyces sp. Agncl-13 TaxID=3400628 RepID=UPI003A86DBAD